MWWLLLALFSVVYTMRQGIPFTLGWWGCVFPFGILAGGWAGAHAWVDTESAEWAMQPQFVLLWGHESTL
jgi:tellurite resistance protein TehA-like permease